MYLKRCNFWQIKVMYFHWNYIQAQFCSPPIVNSEISESWASVNLFHHIEGNYSDSKIFPSLYVSYIINLIHFPLRILDDQLIHYSSKHIISRQWPLDTLHVNWHHLTIVNIRLKYPIVSYAFIDDHHHHHQHLIEADFSATLTMCVRAPWARTV